jgi:agmatinase
MSESEYNNFLGIPEQYSNYAKSAIAILPIPFDGTSSWIKGADKGPDALISASQTVEFYDIETRTELYKRGIHTMAPVLAATSEEMVRLGYESTRKLLADNKFVVTLGGEHAISQGPIQAHAEKHPKMSVLQLDAHSDMRDSYEGSKFNHACIMARAMEMVNTVVSVGIRAQDQSELVRVNPARMFYADEIMPAHNPIRKNWQDEVINELSEEVYVTIDLDVFEIGLMPSTGTPEPGGLGWYDVINLLKRVALKKKIIGFDVVELCPTENRAPDFLAAKLVYKLLNYTFSYSR